MYKRQHIDILGCGTAVDHDIESIIILRCNGKKLLCGIIGNVILNFAISRDVYKRQAVGFPESCADVRISQYESDVRTPKEDLMPPFPSVNACLISFRIGADCLLTFQ